MDVRISLRFASSIAFLSCLALVLGTWGCASEPQRVVVARNAPPPADSMTPVALTQPDDESPDESRPDESRPDESRPDESRIDAEDLEAPLLDGLGEHSWPVTTDEPLAQRFFDQGLVLHYGFNHGEAERSFREATRLDPQCAMCFAGIALTLGPNLNMPMMPTASAPAWQAVERARELAPRATAREQAFIEALAARYATTPPSGGPAEGGRGALDRAYSEAMAEVAAAHPGDADLATLYAEALMVEHPWDYWTRAGEPQPWTPTLLETLEATLESAPEHPFAHHLYIHAVEAGPHPERGLPSAKALATLVPGAGHLVHMPAHIYINVGDYHAASLANEQAVAADQAYFEQVAAQGVYPQLYHPHNYHFLWATTLLEGRSADSLAAALALVEHTDPQAMRDPMLAGMQHFAATPYYALAAFGRWQDLLDEPAPPEELPYTTAIWHFARGKALAARGQLDAAREALEHVRSAADDERLEGVTFLGNYALLDLLDIASAMLAADIADAGGETDAQIEHLRAAVAVEDSLRYDEPPPWGLTTRRYLGQALLDAGRPVEAEAVFREDLERFPDNGWSLYGLRASLRALGKDAEAARVEAKLEDAWQHADVTLSAAHF